MSDSASEPLPTLAEDLQLLLGRGGGELAHGYSDVAAAALVELVILGRIGSQASHGFFANKGERKLFVTDSTPTGVPILDAALSRVARSSRPWGVYRCVTKVQGRVSRLVVERLIERGAIRSEGRPAGWKSKLQIADEAQHREAVFRRDTAYFAPEPVSSPRDAALVDLVRNANENFRIDDGTGPTTFRDWYPPELRDTIVAILEVEGVLTSAGGGGGYEG